MSTVKKMAKPSTLNCMMKSGFPENQIIRAVKDHESGRDVNYPRLKLGIDSLRNILSLIKNTEIWEFRRRNGSSNGRIEQQA